MWEELEFWRVRNGMLWTGVCSLKLHLLRPSPPCDGIKSWGLCEALVIRFRCSHLDGTLEMGSVPMEEQVPGPFLFLSIMWGHSEKVAICQPGREPSPGTRICWRLDLEPPASGPVFKAIQSVALFFVMAAWADWKRGYRVKGGWMKSVRREMAAQ